MYSNKKQIETTSSIFVAVCALKGADCDHDGKQKLSLLVGSNHRDPNMFKFSQLCSFNIFEDDSILMAESVKGSLSEEHSSMDNMMAMTLTKFASVQLTEIIINDEYLSLWDSEIPTPTEALEVYFNNKMFIFGNLDIKDGTIIFSQTDKPERQLRT